MRRAVALTILSHRFALAKIRATAFAALDVSWAVGGSLASAAHGEPRATNDVDVVAILSEADARRFVRNDAASP